MLHHILYSTTQDTVYETCVEDIVVSVLEGYNGSIIAYGQTGTGQFNCIVNIGNHHYKQERVTQLKVE